MKEPENQTFIVFKYMLNGKSTKVQSFSLRKQSCVWMFVKISLCPCPSVQCSAYSNWGMCIRILVYIYMCIIHGEVFKRKHADLLPIDIIYKGGLPPLEHRSMWNGQSQISKEIMKYFELKPVETLSGMWVVIIGAALGIWELHNKNSHAASPGASLGLF